MRVGGVWVAAFVLLPGTAWAQGNPVGPEFRVNTFTTSSQWGPSVAALGSGSFVVVWASDQDGSGPGVFGQRYDGSGVPAGPEFRVNTYTTGVQRNPAVAAAPSGSFVVAWESSDGTDYGVFGQRYDAAGAPLGTEFRANTTVTQDQYRATLAADGVGNFVILWQQGLGGLGTQVFGQRYASSGTPLGVEFRVNTVLAEAGRPSVASDSSGNFMVVWERFGEIAGQRYSGSGAPLGFEFVVAPAPPYWVNTLPSVASDAGRYVVAWFGANTSPQTSWDIYGRRYLGSGVPAGSVFQVNTYTSNTQDDAAVAVDASGNFVIVWESFGQDGSVFGIFGQRFLDSGAPLGPEFRVNTYTAQGQSGPGVAADPAGNFVVAWNSDLQDGSAVGVFAQRFNMIVPVELMDFRVH